MEQHDGEKHEADVKAPRHAGPLPMAAHIPGEESKTSCDNHKNGPIWIHQGGPPQNSERRKRLMQKTDAKMIKMMRLLRALHPDWTESEIRTTAAAKLNRKKKYTPVPEIYRLFEMNNAARYGRASGEMIFR